jgi:hypothetical protein
MSVIALTVKEYAGLFRKHEQTIYRRIRQQRFHKYPVERDGRDILILVPADLVNALRKPESDKRA